MTTDHDVLKAREIAASLVIQMGGDSQRSHNYAADIMAGKRDETSASVRAALAAIRQTREECAAVADRVDPNRENRIASAIRAMGT